MHNLTEFLAKYKHWFLFVALEVLSMVLLFRFNDYQGSVWFTSANYVTGMAYEATSKVTSYLSMGALNEKLTKRNVELEQQVRELSSKLYDKTKDSIYLQKGQYHFLSKFRLIQAKVVSNSLDRPDNFITINKGTWDGVRKTWELPVEMVCRYCIYGWNTLRCSHSCAKFKVKYQLFYSRT